MFLPDAARTPPCHGDDSRYAEDPHWRDLVLFYEYFHGDTGRGLGASHQTGWTALAVRNIEDLAMRRGSCRESEVRGQLAGLGVRPARGGAV